MGMKACCRCGQTKPLSEFYRRPNRASGVMSHCKGCNRDLNPARYATTQVEQCAAALRWSRDNRKRKTEKATTWRKLQGPAFQAATLRRNELMRNFKLDLDTYAEMLSAQDGVCGICGEPPTKANLAVDHDHRCCSGSRKTCGQCLRGLLCLTCNRNLGFVERYLPSILDYLERHPTHGD